VVITRRFAEHAAAAALLSSTFTLAGCIGAGYESGPPITTPSGGAQRAEADASTVPSPLDTDESAHTRWARRVPPRVASSTWPTTEQFEATRASLSRPLTLVRVRHEGHDAVVLARRDEHGVAVVAIVDPEWDAESLCGSPPCPWPAALVAQSPLEEPAALPDTLLDDVAYAHTLLAFEGQLGSPPEIGSYEDEAPAPELPEAAWSIDLDAPELPDLAPHLEALRGFYPMGYCSMDTRPQQAAAMRAVAAAQSGRTGWAVEGWISAVGYWSSSRMAASSYGASHPTGHLRLLEMVGVDPERLLLGLLLQVDGAPRALTIADIRRVVPDLGPAFAARLRALASDARIDPLDRALFTLAIATPPFESDPLYASLPETARALIRASSR
jgi:hypothetical protein